MANLYISEYGAITTVQSDREQAGSEPPKATQKVSYTASAASAAFNGDTGFVRVIADADAFLVFGASPTATASGMFLPGNTVEYFGVEAGQKVAAYDGTS